MVRLSKFRTLISEIAESPKIEKVSFIPPFFVIAIDIIILEHAIRIKATYIIGLTTLLFFLSIIEIVIVIGEIHARYQETSFERILTIKLDDFILERKDKNVKKLVEDFLDVHPQYWSRRNDVYHITCQIMETHKEEAWEKALTDKLNKFIKRRKKMNVDEILKAFIKKYPKYRKYPGKVYQVTCQIMGVPEEKKQDLSQ